MASPTDDQQASNLHNSVYQKILSQFQGDWSSRLNVDQMFVLIDGVLPFEACLYYQVLPLFIEGNRLHLGMVSLNDSAASDYVRRIISYLNYSLICHAISSEALRTVLTAYLNYVGNQQSPKRESFSYGHSRHSAHSRAARRANPNERLTLIVDSPDDLYAAETSQDKAVSSSPMPIPSTAGQPSSPVKLDANAEEASGSALASLDHPTPADIATEAFHLDQNLSSVSKRGQPEQGQPEQAQPDQSLPILHLETDHLDSPVELIGTLPPPKIVQELLARVLLGGIGRLYFEAYPQHGRVVCSQDGVMQSVLDQVTPPVFQKVLQELKSIARIASTPVLQPRQTEVGYLYNRSYVLLRFRFMPGTHGEEATVQVLRGAPLKFYQQQQFNKLEKDALSIAKQLQNKLNEIRVQAYAEPSRLEKFEMLPQLGELLQDIGQQLDDLGHHQ